MNRRGPLPPPGVAARLATLRDLYVAERDADARARLARERPRPPDEPFAILVHRRLRELRALCDLAAHLRKARRPRDGS
jgi:hypothetical protein